MRVFLSLTCPEHHETSKFPTAIRQLIYRQEHDDLFSLIPNRHCSPHSGGQHRLTMNGPRADVVAWLDMFSETFGKDVGPEIAILKHRIRTYFIQNTDKPTYDIKLSDIERQVPVNGKLQMKPWFWHPEDSE